MQISGLAAEAAEGGTSDLVHPHLLLPPFFYSFRDLQRKQESRARKVLKMMAANASSALLRLAAWLLLRLLRFPFDSVVYHEGQLQLVKEALQKEVHSKPS